MPHPGASNYKKNWNTCSIFGIKDNDHELIFFFSCWVMVWNIFGVMDSFETQIKCPESGKYRYIYKKKGCTGPTLANVMGQRYAM